AADSTRVEDTFICFAITIVVDAIAGFIAGKGLIEALGPAAVLTALRPARANPHVLRAVGSAVAISNGSDLAVGTDAFVDRAITVIVDIVADLLGCAPAGSACVGDAFVDVTVTVVINAVAHLGVHLAAGTAGIQRSLVDLPITV